LLIKKFSGTREFSKIIVDPFGGAKPRALRRGKEAPLRVNPEQPQAFRPGSRRVDNGIKMFFNSAKELDPNRDIKKSD